MIARSVLFAMYSPLFSALPARKATPHGRTALPDHLPRREVVHDLTEEGPAVERELLLVKMAGTGVKRIESLRLADIFRARVVDSTIESFVFEITGSAEKLDAFINLMKPLGLVDISRTGVVAIARGAAKF